MAAPESMPLTCPFCAARMPSNAAFCPGCGISMETTPRATGKVGRLPANVAGALAYFSFLPAIFFLAAKPFNKNVFVRFHSIQCLAVWAAALLFATLLKVASYVMFLIPIIGPLVIFVLAVVAVLAGIFLWLALVVKAFQGEFFRVPYIGSFAEQYAGAR